MSSGINTRKMMVHVGVIGLVVSGILYTAQNCGPRDASSIKTLDNFAAGSPVFVNQCSASPDHRTRKVVAAAMAKVVLLDAENRHPMTVATHDALTAVPDPLLMWAMRHYGTVIVSPETAELCSAAITQGGGKRRSFEPDSLAGCFVYFPKTENTREVLNFNVANDPVAIQHALLKTFSSAISQLAPEVEPKIYKALLAFQKNVARAFIADLVDDRQRAFNINELKPFLGNFDLDEVTQAGRSYVPGARLGSDPLDAFSFDDDKSGRKYPGFAFNKKRFLDFTFAEAFDSFYCNNWGEFNEGKARAIARGEAPLADARDLVNTRKRMAVFFPRTHKVFAAGIDEVLNALAQPKDFALGEDTESSGFALQGGGRYYPPSRAFEQESPVWEGTKALFGSLWSNTGGAAANAYGRYTARVEKSVNSYYESGGTNVVAAVASGATGGVAKTYEDEVAAPIREQTQKRFDVQLKGGASINQAATNAVLLAVGDQTGATPFVEGAYGVDTAEARFLSGKERAVRVAQGGLQLIDTATGVGGLVGVGKAGTKVVSATARETTALGRAAENAVDVGGAFNGAGPGTGLWKAADTATAGPNALKATREAFLDAERSGLAPDAEKFLTGGKYNRLESYGAGMAEDATATTLRKGDKIYVVTDAANGTDVDKLVWGANKPPHPDVLGSKVAYDEFVNQTALPDLKTGQRTNARVLELEVTADGIPAVNSTIQPNFGKQGGAQQTFLAYNKEQVQGSNLFKVVGDTADPAKPIGVYKQYDNFMQSFDEAMDATTAATAARQAFDQSLTGAVQDWGKLTVASQLYQGSGDSISDSVRPTEGVDLGVVEFDPFKDPKGSNVDILSEPVGGGETGSSELAH